VRTKCWVRRVESWCGFSVSLPPPTATSGRDAGHSVPMDRGSGAGAAERNGASCEHIVGGRLSGHNMCSRRILIEPFAGDCLGWCRRVSDVYCGSALDNGDEAVDAKEAIAAAKKYLNEVYADEQVTNLGLEEVEHIPASGNWAITLAFSRPWNTPRTRAQEILENLGGVSSLKGSSKVITIADDGTVLSMKNPQRADAAE
jgi:hypothetical protein